MDPLTSPVVVDGIVSEEKLAELLALQTEYPELDYKATIDLSSKSGVIELAKDVGAMGVRGGYILGGVDNDGALTGLLDAVDPGWFDEANLVPKLLPYLSPPVEIRTKVVEREGHRVAVICVLPSPFGCTFCGKDGVYSKDGREKVVFRHGDVFWRDGTRSVRIGQAGLEEVIRRRIAIEKETWIQEQQEIRRRERIELEQAYETRRIGEGPLGAVNLDLETRELTLAALELIRRDDTVALRHLLNDAFARAKELIERDDIEDGLASLVNSLTCLAATFMSYQLRYWFDQLLAILVQIYSIPLAREDARQFGYRGSIPTEDPAPRVWLVVIERVFALGALAVRLHDWASVRALTLQLPEPLLEGGYEANWLRHALTMASRAQQFEQRGEGQQVSLLSLARTVIGRLPCLRPDGLAADDDSLLTSLTQFDVLSNIVAVGGAKSIEGRVFYSNFARFRQGRVQPIVERLLSDAEMRSHVFPLDDEKLAIALKEIGRRAQVEGARFAGFDGWIGTGVDKFIHAHLRDRGSADA